MDRIGETPFPIVGIGASAGGLDALSELVKSIPTHSGMAYVVIQHLSADHPSIMDQLLSSHSDIAVIKIEEGMQVEPDKIYVIPAGPSVTMAHGKLTLHDRKPERGVRTPIDEFLSSLAKERGSRAFGVILSGTGSDGTMGVRAIKAAGGFVIVQESESARFPGMPDSALATGLVDFVLKPKAIPDRLIEIARFRAELENGHRREDMHQEIKDALPHIIKLIDEENGHDFSSYKPGTLVRRIDRRMTLLRDPTVASFIERLEENRYERTHLLQDFLIGVTQFFRNPEAFDRLRQDAILPLLNRDQDRFRVWVPGCATGEEAFSIAILFHEAMDAAGDRRSFQVFGTDIDAAALFHARAGGFTESQLETLSEDRRKRFFVRNEDQYYITPALRENCVFAPHNLIQDPPFSRIDLISCRNLMIYLNADMQANIIPRFHYALNKKGFLFLGPSETLGKQDRFFHPIDRDVRLFQRNDEKTSAYSSLGTYQSDTQKPQKRMPRGRSNHLRDTPPLPDFEQQVTGYFLREFAAPFAVINADNEVSFLSERMGAFVKPAQGTVSAALDQFLARELRLPVRTAVAEARDQGRAVEVRNIVVEDGEPQLFDLDVRPLPFASGSLIITLRPVRTQDTLELVKDAGSRDRAARDLVERELALTRQQLSMTAADYETTEQELRSSNEELLSMNEELQSSNEELETSREELQSINEELETINAELTENNRQLVEVNSDLRNLFESTEIATVFLDQNSRIRRFTPTAQRLFGIQDRDIGRALSDLKWNVTYGLLDEDVAAIAETLQPIEREVRVDVTDETFLLRLRPYRRIDDRIDGTVLTLFDISDRKRFERQIAENADILERQLSELETLYDTTPVGLALLDRDLRYIRINERLAEIDGFSVEDHVGNKQEDLIPEIDGKIREIQLEVMASGKPSMGIEVHGTTPAEPDRERDWIADYYPVLRNGEVIAVGCCVQEITEQKALQRLLEDALRAAEESEAKLQRLFDAAPAMIALHEGPEHRFVYSNATHRAATGHRDLNGKSILEAFPELWDQGVVERFDQIFATREGYEVEPFKARLDFEDGPVERWFSQFLQPWFTSDNEVGGVMSFAFDITDRHDATERQELLLQELQHRVKNTMATVLAIMKFSAKNADDLSVFTKTLENRLQAIARTHDLLTQSNWDGAALSDIIRQELEPYTGEDAERLTILGDDVDLSAKQMLSLALAIHELATNAAKYGALSSSRGTLTIKTTHLPNGRVALEWREAGGPPVKKPEKGSGGFGSFLLDRVLGSDLEGEALTRYDADGLFFAVEFPMRATKR
ncbi:MAG: chemotaxis protein CheB [Pseudomonadota bacterium]